MQDKDAHNAAYRMEDEPELLRRLAAGDEAAFTTLYRYYQPEIVRSLQPFATETDPMELVQDTFYKVWVKRESLAGVQSFRAYLYRMVRNRLLDLRKGRTIATNYKHREASRQPESDAASSTEWQLEYQSLQAVAQQAIHDLPAKQQAVFLAFLWEDCSREEIAHRLGISIHMVDKHLYRANKTVRAAIEAKARES